MNSRTVRGHNSHKFSGYTPNQWFTEDSTSAVALVPNVRKNGTLNITGVGVDMAYIRYKYGGSALVGSSGASGGQTATVNIDQCYVGEKVMIDANTSTAFRGWQYTGTTTIKNSYSLATLGTNTTGHGYGLFTHRWDGSVTVENCYNANGPISSYASATSVKSSYQTEASPKITTGVTTLDKAAMKGNKVLSLNGAMPALNAVAKYYVATDEYPELSIFRGLEVEDLGIWDGTYSAVPSDTNGDGIFEITSAEELAYIINNGGSMVVKETQKQTQTVTQEKINENGDPVLDEEGNPVTEEVEQEVEVVVDVVKTACSFVLTNNIFLNNIELFDWETGALASGYTPNPWYKNKTFQGSIDGNGYTVYGLYYNSNIAENANTSGSHNGIGLIPKIAVNTTTNISKLGIDYAYMNANDGVSPFVGYSGRTSVVADKPVLNIDQCYVGENVVVRSGSAGAFLGYTAGCNMSITNSYSLGRIYSNITPVSGQPAINFALERATFSGNFWNLTHETYMNCYNAVGAVVGGSWSDRTTKARNYAVGWVEDKTAKGEGLVAWNAANRTVENMQGLDALTATTKMPNLNKDADGNTTSTYTATKGYPVLTAFVGKFYVKPAASNDSITEDGGEATYEYWDGSKPYEVKSSGNILNAESYANVKAVLAETGEGTEEDPYKITNGTDLYAVMAYGGEEGAYFQLQNDIYLNDLSKINWLTGSVANGYEQRTWRPNVAFAGNIDGNGHTIYGLYCHDGKTDYGTAKTYACGFVSKVGSGTVTIKDLGIDNCYFRYDSNTGAFIGSVYTTKDKDGNILGIGTASLSGCYAGENVTLDGNYTGLVGFVQDTTTSVSIDRCYSLATCKANTGAGLLGYSYWDNGATVTVSNSYNATGKITGIKRGNQTYTNCYEAVDGPVNTGVTTITADNMKGKDVLTSSTKMAGLRMARAYVENKADFATANYNNFVYLPAGTIFDAEYQMLFFDNRMAPIDAENVMFFDRMIRGAYVKFLEYPDVTKIHVPVSKAHRVVFGTAQELMNSGYYDIETEIVSENLANQPDYAVNYLFITDTHFDSGDPVYTNEVKKQLQLVVDMANEMEEIDFVCLGGDISNGSYEVTHGYTYDVLDADGNQTFDTKGNKITKTIKGYIDSVQSFLEPLKTLTKPVFILTGNHDDNAYSTDTSSYKGYPYNRTLDGIPVYAPKDAYEAFKLKIVDSDKWSDGVIDVFVNRTLPDGTVVQVVQNEDTVDDNNTEDDDFNSKYYYYDLEAKKTRVICLNASDFLYAYDANGNFDPVVKKASSTQTYEKYYNGRNFWGYSDAQMKWLAEEALTADDDWNYIFLSHMGIENNVANTQSYANGGVLADIITAYQTKTEYVNEDLGIKMNGRVDATGRILSYQFGHEHYVADVYSADMQLWQILSSTANSSPAQKSAYYNKQVYSEEVAAIDVMSVTEGYVYRQALGEGTTKFHINDFQTQEGDVTVDGTLDIRDLVKINNLNNAGLPTAILPTGDLAKMRKILLGA